MQWDTDIKFSSLYELKKLIFQLFHFFSILFRLGTYSKRYNFADFRRFVFAKKEGRPSMLGMINHSRKTLKKNIAVVEEHLNFFFMFQVQFLIQCLYLMRFDTKIPFKDPSFPLFLILCALVLNVSDVTQELVIKVERLFSKKGGGLPEIGYKRTFPKCLLVGNFVALLTWRKISCKKLNWKP